MSQRNFPVAKLIRFTKEQHKALQAQAKREQQSFTAYIRAALARDVVLRQSSRSR